MADRTLPHYKCPKVKGKVAILSLCCCMMLIMEFGMDFDLMKDYVIFHPNCWIPLPPSSISSLATAASHCSSWLKILLHCGIRESSDLSSLTCYRTREPANVTKMTKKYWNSPLRTSGGVVITIYQLSSLQNGDIFQQYILIMVSPLPDTPYIPTYSNPCNQMGHGPRGQPNTTDS